MVGRCLKVGHNFSRQQGCFIDPTHCWLITIGDNVTLSIRVTILAYDASMYNRLGYARIRKVEIGNNVFVGANSTILPGVTIGDNCVIGANSVVTKNVCADSVVAGNPARVICRRSDWDKKIDEEFNNSQHFGVEYKYGNITERMKKEMIKKIENRTGYIK